MIPGRIPIINNSNFHFSLESTVEQKFRSLLALELDATREKRVDGDTFCTIVQQIQSNERKATCVLPTVDDQDLDYYGY